MAARLPQELVDQVIDHLWSDRTSLLECSLVCHSWVPAARTHLFSFQRLTGVKDCFRFEQLLECVPAVAHYIRKLVISEPMSTAYAQNWINRIPAIVAPLTRLQALELVGLHYVSFKSSSPEALSVFSRLDTLVFADVYFDNTEDVYALLSAACNIRDLCYYRVGCRAESYGNPAAKARVPPLRRLVLDSWTASMMLEEWLLPHTEHLDVHALMVRWRERGSIDVLNGLFRVCGLALESVYVELPTTMDESQEQPSLQHNLNLRSVEIDGLVLPGCVAWTSALLESLRAGRLEKVSVSLLVLNTSAIAAYEWGAVDSILARPAFAGTALNMTVNLALHSSNDPVAVREAVMAHLPGVARRGKLTVSCA
ncbi:hypothetical protein BD413DRAFT_1000 [Trametes elegans]|nr:hypothetical protein BD413DRAFT_1000 [Trametes elegans]